MLELNIANSDSHVFLNSALDIYVENESSKLENTHMLKSVSGELYMTPLNDKCPENVVHIRNKEALIRNQCWTGGLAETLQIKLKTKVILTVNTDIEGRLVNDQLETIMHISSNSDGNKTKIYITLEEKKADLKKRV